jgi:hypothetical protein
VLTTTAATKVKQIEEGDVSTGLFIGASRIHVHEVNSLTGALENLAALMTAVGFTIWICHTRAAAVKVSQSLASKARF